MLAFTFILINNFKKEIYKKILIFFLVCIFPFNIFILKNFSSYCLNSENPLKENLTYEVDYGCNIIDAKPFNLKEAFLQLKKEEDFSFGNLYVPGVYYGLLPSIINGMKMRDLTQHKDINQQQNRLNSENGVEWISASAKLINKDNRIKFVLVADTKNFITLRKELTENSWEEIYANKHNFYKTNISILKKKCIKWTNIFMPQKFSNYAKQCILQNKLLVKKKLVIQNFGNVSIRVDRDHFVIKPSGVNLTKVNISDMPIINIKTEKKISGKLKPSSDTLTHLEIYKKYDKIKSISHTHSTYATVWAQSGKPIPLIGTTHADFWKNEVPLIKFIKQKFIEKNYERYTGKLILNNLRKKKLSPYTCPGVIVSGHGPFSWGTEYESSVLNSEILEFVAKTTYLSMQLKIKEKLPKYISNKHYQRKHGKKAYYGQ